MMPLSRQYATRVLCFILLLLLLLLVVELSAFSFQRPATTGVTTQTRIIKPLFFSKRTDWNEAHVAHNLAEVHEPNADELRASEQAAALDAHDALDAGMEAAAEERAVMLAAEMTHWLKTGKQQQEQQQQPNHDNDDDWNDLHVAQNLEEVHEENAQELLESEQAAALDAHDAPDPAMEAAAEEWAVMLAAEKVHKLKEKSPQRTNK